MKKLIQSLFLIVLCYTFSNFNSFAQSFALGVVDVEAIVKEMPEAQAADKELIDLSKKFQDTILE